MFSLSHPVDGTFRLEIHAPPSELDGADARRLRCPAAGGIVTAPRKTGDRFPTPPDPDLPPNLAGVEIGDEVRVRR